MAYADLLKDPRWQKKRLEILQRDEWKCFTCGSTDNTLHVHHIAYKGMPWDTPDDMLITMCETCHNNYHMIKKIDDGPFKRLLELYIESIQTISYHHNDSKYASLCAVAVNRILKDG